MNKALASIGLLIAILTTAATVRADETGVVAAAPASSQIAKLFDQYPLIMMGEWHRNSQQHAFLRALIRDPAFICRVDDIVIEFGNARLQNIADAYVSGENVSEAQLQSMWRETEVMFAWNSPVYRQFYETVREVNQKHVCAHPVRLLLGDPPIDWEKVRTLADFQKVEDRDEFFVHLIEREVLVKNHRALLISGVLHALKKMPPDEKDDISEPCAAQLIERKYPGRLFAVALVTTPAAAETLKMGPPPSFRVVKGSELERANYSLIAPATSATQVVVNGKPEWKLDASQNWPPLGEVVDGVLYLGGDKTVIFPSPTIYLEPVYQQQLRQRARIIKESNGQDFESVLDDLIRQAKDGEETTHP